MLDKIKRLVGGSADKVKDGLDKAVDMIDDKTAGGKSGRGWFDRIKQQVSELF